MDRILEAGNMFNQIHGTERRPFSFRALFFFLHDGFFQLAPSTCLETGNTREVRGISADGLYVLFGVYGQHLGYYCLYGSSVLSFFLYRVLSSARIFWRG